MPVRSPAEQAVRSLPRNRLGLVTRVLLLFSFKVFPPFRLVPEKMTLIPTNMMQVTLKTEKLKFSLSPHRTSAPTDTCTCAHTCAHTHTCTHMHTHAHTHPSYLLPLRYDRVRERPLISSLLHDERGISRLSAPPRRFAAFPFLPHLRGWAGEMPFGGAGW